MAIKKTAVLLMIILILAACTTMNEKGAEKKALKITGQLNNGEIEELTEESLNPLLFDTELLYTDKLIINLWYGLTKAGYSLENPVVSEIIPAGPESYKVFADSWEAKTFYEKYAPEESFLVTVSGENDHQMVLLLNRKLSDKYSIVAYKVVR